MLCFFVWFCKQAGRPKHNSRSTNALRGPRRVAADPEALKIRGALVFSSRACPPQTVFTSRALCMDRALQTPPRTAASTWTVAEYSCEVRGEVPSGCSHGRSLLQVYGHAVRVQALSLGGAAGLRLRSSVPACGLEARGEGPTGGLPSLQRSQTRRLLPTHGLCLSVLSGVHEREPADLLRVPKPDEPEFCSGDPGAGRGAEVGDMTAGLQVRRGVSAAAMGALSVGSARGGGCGASPFLLFLQRVLPHVKSTGSRVTDT